MTLEDRIKALMESHQGEETLSEATIGKREEDKKGKVDSDETDEDEIEDKKNDSEDKDEDADSEKSKSKDTDVEKAGGLEGKKNKAEVKEGTDPFGKLDANGGDEAGGTKTGKLKVGLNKKETAGKLTSTASADTQEDNGDNERLKVGLSKKDTAGKLTGLSAGGTENENQARNNVKVNEHVAALFAGEELSEDFQNKAITIFEAAVESVATDRIANLQEEYANEIIRLQEEQEQQILEAVETIKDDLVENIDGFLSVVVEQWIEENRVALESGIKVELVNGFIDGLKTLFKENYVEIPEDKLDIIEEQANEISSLTENTDALNKQVSVLEGELNILKAKLVFESVADELTVVQAEKFKELVENVEFTTMENYAEKLETLKEAYFAKGSVAEKIEPQVTSDAKMDSYVQAVASRLKF